MRHLFLPADAKRIAHAVRSHWEVENRLAGVDPAVWRSQSTVAAGCTKNNDLAIVRHIVMNLLSPQYVTQGQRRDGNKYGRHFPDTFRAELLAS